LEELYTMNVTLLKGLPPPFPELERSKMYLSYRVITGGADIPTMGLSAFKGGRTNTVTSFMVPYLEQAIGLAVG
jgi:hypothetical protein